MVLLQQVYRIEAVLAGKFLQAESFRAGVYCRKGKGSCAIATATM